MLGRTTLHKNAGGNKTKELFLACEALVNEYNEEIGCLSLYKDEYDHRTKYTCVDNNHRHPKIHIAFSIIQQSDKFFFEGSSTVENISEAIKRIECYFDDDIRGELKD